MDTHCRSICKNNISKNYVYPVIDVDAVDSNCPFKRDFRDNENNKANNENNKVGCTVCYMKACHRIGVGTFGPISDSNMPALSSNIQGVQQVIQGLPDEPLDAQLPECHVNDSSVTKKSIPAKASE